MGSLTPVARVIRFEEYGPLFILCGAAGALYAGLGSGYGFVGLLAFVALFSASAFVLNDIADREEDASTPGSRNPLATGQLPLSRGVALFALLAAGSAASLLFVSSGDVYIALLVYGLYWGYSWGPGFRARPGVDVIVHGAVPALFVVMGASLTGTPAAGGFVLAGVVFCLAAMSGVLQEVRDLDRDAPSRRTTALLLGKERSADLALLMMGSGVAIYAAAVVAGGLPAAMLAIVPFSWFLAAPVLSLRRGEETADAAIRAIRARGLALAGGAFLLYLAMAAASI